MSNVRQAPLVPPDATERAPSLPAYVEVRDAESSWVGTFGEIESRMGVSPAIWWSGPQHKPDYLSISRAMTSCWIWLVPS